MPTASHFEPSEPQTVGRDAGDVARADDGGAGAVAQQERDRAVVGSHVLRQLLGADDEHVVRGAARMRASAWAMP